MVRYTAKDKCTAASKAYSDFSSEEYRQSFRIKRRAFRLVPPNGGLLVIIYCRSAQQRVSADNFNRHATTAILLDSDDDDDDKSSKQIITLISAADTIHLLCFARPY